MREKIAKSAHERPRSRPGIQPNNVLTAALRLSPAAPLTCEAPPPRADTAPRDRTLVRPTLYTPGGRSQS
ncbi:unnamed protein product [Gadus morhua 'NCC']